jgi:hypothetical protein
MHDKKNIFSVKVVEEGFVFLYTRQKFIPYLCWYKFR